MIAEAGSVEHLYRSATQRMLAGICGGLGEYFEIDPTIVRIVYVLVTIATGLLLGLVLYLAFWLIIPTEAAAGRDVRETLRDSMDEMAQSARVIGSEVQATLRRTPRGSEEGAHHHLEPAAVVGLVLVVLGAIFLLANLDLWGWLHWIRFWPIILVIIGLLLLLKRR